MGLFKKRGQPEQAPETPAELKDSRGLNVSVVLVQELARKGDIPGLVSSAVSPDKEVRQVAVKALGDAGGPQAQKALRSVFDTDADPAIRQLAADGLAALGDFQPLRHLLTTGPPEAQTRAVKVLLGRGESGAGILNEVLDSDVPGVAMRILRVIQMHFRLGSDQQFAELRRTLAPVVPRLLRILERADIASGAKSCNELVATTVATLGSIRDPSAVPVLDHLFGRILVKVERDGVQRELVDDGVLKASYVSTLDEVKHIIRAIVACGGEEEKYTSMIKPWIPPPAPRPASPSGQ